MSKTIVNKTVKALRVPLPHGKVLHLGPKQSGQISIHDADHPPLQKLVAAGELEVFDHADNEAVPDPRHEKFPFES
jgi:hypothetical protein